MMRLLDSVSSGAKPPDLLFDEERLRGSIPFLGTVEEP